MCEWFNIKVLYIWQSNAALYQELLSGVIVLGGERTMIFYCPNTRLCNFIFTEHSNFVLRSDHLCVVCVRARKNKYSPVDLLHGCGSHKP